MSLLKVSNISENRLFLEDIETNDLLLGKLGEIITIEKENVELVNSTSIKIKNITEVLYNTIKARQCFLITCQTVDLASYNHQEFKIISSSYASPDAIFTVNTINNTNIKQALITKCEIFPSGITSIELSSIDQYGFVTKKAGYEDDSNDKNKYDWMKKGTGIKVLELSTGVYEYRRIKNVIINSGATYNDDYLIIKFDRPLLSGSFSFPNNKLYTIVAGSSGNINGIVEQDNMGNSLIELQGVNAQMLFSCSEYVSNNDNYLLIFDRLDTILTGTIFTSEGSNLITGNATRFLEQLKIGDYILIDNIKYLISEIISNNKIKTSYPIKKSHGQIIAYKTSHEYTNMECLINGKFDFDIKNYNPRALSNCINIISLRNGRTLYYAFNSKKKTGKTSALNIDGSADIIDSDIVDTTIIHKLWLNGSLLNFYDYEVLNGKIKIKADILHLNYFNNEYTYMMYDSNNSNGDNDNYAKIQYNAFNTNYVTEEEYLTSLYEFKFFEGFSENMSYTYDDFKNTYTQEKFGYVSDRNNSISFQSAIGTYENIDDDLDTLSLVDSIRNILNNTENFRIIRYVKNLDRYVIYLNCKLRNPENETVGTDYDKISYTIDFSYKIVASNRLFGNEEWGTFSPFGLKLKSDIVL